MSESRNEVDDVLEELHQIRVGLDERSGHDPEKFFALLHEYEQQLLREGRVQVPPPSPEYVRRVREGLARMRRHPHLLDCPEEGDAQPVDDDAKFQPRHDKSAA